MLKKRGAPEKGFFAQNKLLIAIATLIGTVIGAGILGIPYVVAKTGFLYGLGMIIFIGVVFIFLNLFIGEIVLRTKGKHQLTGYAEKYLGKKGKIVMAISMTLGNYGALTAYLIGEGEALKSIFGMPGWLAYIFSSLPLALGHFLQENMYLLLFFIVGFTIVSRGLKAAGKTELIAIILLIVVVFLTGIFSYNDIDKTNYTPFNPAFLFLPYGVILFAFIGSPGIPELAEVLEHNKAKMKKAIIIGSIVPIIIYVLFTVIIVGLVGLDHFELLEPNQRIATVALSMYSSPYLGLLANFLAVLAMFTSFLTLGIALLEMYHYDYKLSRPWSLLLTFSVPLLIAVGGFSTFIAVLGFTGAFAGGLDGILLTLMFWKAKYLGNRKPEFSLGKMNVIGWILIIMFSVGILQQVWTSLF